MGEQLPLLKRRGSCCKEGPSRLRRADADNHKVMRSRLRLALVLSVGLAPMAVATLSPQDRSGTGAAGVEVDDGGSVSFDASPALMNVSTVALSHVTRRLSNTNGTVINVQPGVGTLQEACTSTCQFIVRQERRLDLVLHQRSSDVVVGLPHDVIAWSVLLHLVCREVGLRSRD